ncbi:MAG: VanZ family protein [Candidatus Thiodiazotropha sp.]
MNDRAGGGAASIAKPGNFRLLLAIALVVISYLAFTPQESPVAADINDKIAHILAFVVLAFLLDFSWPQSPWRPLKTIPLLGYGLFIEAVQSLLPNRVFSLWDFGADIVGVLIYPLLLPLLMRYSVLRNLRGRDRSSQR